MRECHNNLGSDKLRKQVEPSPERNQSTVIRGDSVLGLVPRAIFQKLNPIDDVRLLHRTLPITDNELLELEPDEQFPLDDRKVFC